MTAPVTSKFGNIRYLVAAIFNIHATDIIITIRTHGLRAHKAI
jgi:hypothetical protein